MERSCRYRARRVAEASKLLENIYRAVNIALVNELKVTFDHMGIDVWEVIEAAKTKPFGFQAFYPGPGLGGHCIPLDPFYLSWKAAEYGVWTRFIELAGEINHRVFGGTEGVTHSGGKSSGGGTAVPHKRSKSFNSFSAPLSGENSLHPGNNVRAWRLGAFYRHVVSQAGEKKKWV